jgi:hypothetical protein
VDQKIYFRYCKTLSVFERKIPLTFSLEFRFHQEFFPPISLLNISVYRLQPRLFIVCHILKKPKRTIKSYGSTARLDQAIVIKA